MQWDDLTFKYLGDGEADESAFRLIVAKYYLYFHPVVSRTDRIFE